jgi:translation initiation factor 4A
MRLNASILRGVYSYGFEKPSPIQQRTIMAIVKGGDVIGQAPSGTGKTGAFAIGLLQQMDMQRAFGVTQGLVLSPTRELAQQTYDVVCAIGDYAAERREFAGLFVGGERVANDMQRLRSGGVTVAVGTPGRVAQLIQRGALRATAIKCVVLDEADELLSQGFAEQVYDIFKFMPKDVQIVLFSATMPTEVLELTNRFMRNPTRVLMAPQELTLRGIKQFYVSVAAEHKLATVIDLYETISIAQAVIFAGRRVTVEWIGRMLVERDFTVGIIHADMGRSERQDVMESFKRGTLRVLVSSDLTSRGIDVQHVNIVMNFDLPSSPESYLHRIGRSGRYGRRGIAINLVSDADVPALQAIEAHYKMQVGELPMNFTDFLSDDAPE